LDVRTVIDAGANVGAFTLFITDAFPGATVISLEPESGNYSALQRNIELNKRSKVQALNAAIWSENVSLAVTDEAISRERELSFTVDRPSANGTGTRLATVDGLTLDALLAKLGTDRADVVKLDIEGAEAELFKTPRDIELFMARCRLLAIEIHDEAFDRIFFTSSLDNLGIRHVQFGETLYAFGPQ
jgi:FkbM family methyltransferase